MSDIMKISYLVNTVRHNLQKNESCNIDAVKEFEFDIYLNAFLARTTSANIVEYSYILLTLINEGIARDEDFIKNTFLPLCSATLDSKLLSAEQLISIWEKCITIHYDDVLPKPIQDTMKDLSKHTDMEPYELDIISRVGIMIMKSLLNKAERKK